jgi:hypothetical protein
MKLTKAIFDFYIYSSIHVALAVFSLSWLTLLEFGIDFDKVILSFIFFASITGYNFVKYFGLAKFHHRSLTSRLQFIQVFSLGCFFIMGYFAVQLTLKTLGYIFIFGAVTFFYAIPFLPKYLYLDTKKNLRDIGGVKIYIIALVWAGVTVLLPLLNNDYSFNLDVWLTASQRLIFVTILILPFEIRDLHFDSLKLSTIPQKIGVKSTKIIGVFLGLLFFSIEFFKDELDPKHIINTLIITITAVFFLLLSKKNQSSYFSSFWVESIPILWLLLYLIV